jgi:hypothetical protein
MKHEIATHQLIQCRVNQHPKCDRVIETEQYRLTCQCDCHETPPSP